MTEQWIQEPLVTDEDLRDAHIEYHDGPCPLCDEDDV